MKEALKMAQKSLIFDEVPVGCVIVKEDKIIARGFNFRETKNSAIGHAEIMAINKANKKLGSWRLADCDIYVTIEPCIMCSGALIQSRIRNIYYGAKDNKGGAVVSSINVFDAKNINHHPNIEGGILEHECSEIISSYFKNKRKK